MDAICDGCVVYLIFVFLVYLQEDEPGNCRDSEAPAFSAQSPCNDVHVFGVRGRTRARKLDIRDAMYVTTAKRSLAKPLYMSCATDKGKPGNLPLYIAFVSNPQ